MRRTLLSFSIVLPCVVLTIGGCGGSAFESGPNGLGSGGTATAGSGSGVSGSGAVAGSGASAQGGAIGVAGTSSSGGAIGVAGTSSAGATNAGGSAGTDIQACTSNVDCEVVPAGCCSCGLGALSDYTSINVQYEQQYSQRCQAADIACGPCPDVPADPDPATNYFVPTCQAGRCAVVDLRTTDITACASPADCSLRGGVTCCPGCDVEPVALNTKNEPELSQLVCGTEPVACSGCVSPAQFSNYAVGCNAGRCSVQLACTQLTPCPG